MIERMAGELELMKLEARLSKREIQSYRQETRIIRKETKQLNRETNFLREQVKSISEILKVSDENRMKLFKANLLTKLVEKIAKVGKLSAGTSENLVIHSKTRTIRMAQSIKKEAFVKITGMPEKFFTVLQDFEEVSSSKSIQKVISNEGLVHSRSEPSCP